MSECKISVFYDTVRCIKNQQSALNRREVMITKKKKNKLVNASFKQNKCITN